MNYSGVQYSYGLVATGAAAATNVNGNFRIGTPAANRTYGTPPDIAYSLTMQIADGDSLTIDMATGAVTGTVAGAYQVETATAAGTITATGNATVTVTSALVTGSPLAVSVAVTDTDTAATWAGKVRDALAAVSAITAHYTVGGASTAISLTALVKAANDATLNIALDNGTCTGIAPAATSTDTTAGVAESYAYRKSGAAWDAVDAEGVALEAATAVHSVLLASATTSTGEVAGVPTVAGKTVSLAAGEVDLSVSPAGTHPWSGQDVTFTASGGDVLLTLDIHATT